MKITKKDPSTQIAIGEQVRFTPQAGSGRRWWTVQARDDRYLIATVELPFGRGIAYTIVDFVGFQDNHYNGQGPGVVRSSCNTLGGGWDIDPANPRPSCEELLEDLIAGKVEFSLRRILVVREIEVR